MMTTIRGARVLWIAADLMQEAWTIRGDLALQLSGILLVPFMMGWTDGRLRGVAAWPGGAELRFTLLSQVAGPASIALALFVGVFVPRRLKREIEPLLAAPVSDREIVAGSALPALLLGLAAVAPALASGLAGRALGAGAMPGGLPRELGRCLLASQACSVWCIAAMVDASFKGRGMRGILFRTLPAVGLLAAADAAGLGLAAAGLPRAVAPLHGAVLAAGAGALWVVSQRVGREDLILAR